MYKLTYVSFAETETVNIFLWQPAHPLGEMVFRLTQWTFLIFCVDLIEDQSMWAYLCAHLKFRGIFPACDPAAAVVWTEWCMFVNELLCEWRSVTAGLTASHIDSGLCGLCDAVMLHIKKGLIEICRGSKGCRGDRSTSNNNKTGRPSGTAMLKLPGSRDTLDKIKAENTHFTSH